MKRPSPAQIGFTLSNVRHEMMEGQKRDANFRLVNPRAVALESVLTALKGYVAGEADESTVYRAVEELRSTILD